jgi:hypothetical protein
MKAKLYLLITLLVLFPSDANCAAWANLARYAGVNPGWFGPASQWWNVITDYEESHWEMGPHKYDFDSVTVYRGDTSSITKRFWRINGQQYFSTVYTPPEGEPTTDTDPFNFYEERRTYSWNSGDGVMTQTINTSTYFWVKHVVDHYPNSSTRLSPASGTADLDWYLADLEAPYDDYPAASTFGYTKNAEVPSSSNGGAGIPYDDVEVWAYGAGKTL